MQQATGKQDLQAPAIAITLSRDSSTSSQGSTDAASQVLTPTASRSSGASNSQALAAQQNRPTPLKRLSGIPKGLKLNLRKGSNRSARPADPLAAPLGLLCVRVIAARNLTSKDRNGKSDPWLLIKVGDCRRESDVVKASLNPRWGESEGISKNTLASDGSTDKEAFAVAPVWAETLPALRIEIVVWDKDNFKKDEYLGEIHLGLEDLADIYREAIPVAYGAPDNQPFWKTITTSKSKTKVSGDLLLKIGWLAPPAHDLDRIPSDSSGKSVASEPLGLALASKATILASRTSLSRYTQEHQLSESDTNQIRKIVSDQLQQIIAAGSVRGKESKGGSKETGNSNGGRLGWTKLRRKRRETMQERVFAAPPNEGVGTMRLDQNPHGALSNELAGASVPNTGSSSDSSSPMDDDDEEDEVSDAAAFSKDDASATSEASSLADLDDLDEDDGADDYFNVALGMHDTPSVAGKPSEQNLQPDATAPLYMPGPATPDAPEKKKKTLFPNVFKRTGSSKSIDKALKPTLKPDLVSYDSFISDTGSAGPSEPPSGSTTPNAYRRKKFTRRKVYLNADDSGQVGAVDLDDGKKKKKHKRKAPKTGRRRKASQASAAGLGGYSISTGASQDEFLGVVFVEVKGANNLPRWRNMTRTGWDMDPFCIISFGQKVFRTRVIRHSRNPVWDERLFFHVKRHEHAYQILFTLFDWDKMSSNDYVGEVPLLLNELNSKAPKPSPENGIFPVTAEGKIIGDELQDYVLTLGSRSAELEESSKEQPTITVRAKFTPYSALRQRFWRTYLKQYDTDDSETWSYVEIYSLLDSLGATLTRATIDSFFTRFGKSPEGTLTAEEAIICLEDELTKPRSEKREVEVLPGDINGGKSGSNTPLTEMTGLALGDNAKDGGLEFTGEQVTGEPAGGVPYKETILPIAAPGAQPTGLGSRTASSSSSTSQLTSLTPLPKSGSASPSDAPSSTDNSDSLEPHELERVINIKTCPLCHKKLSKKAEVDMVSHLAVCASQDWSSLDSLTVANFVSTSQAHRKWLTKLVTKVSHGTYKLGADSANILVQDRMTGQMLEEKMQVYVRLGIRLWYRAAGSSSRMEANRIKKLLRSMTLKQGVKFDSPESVAEIPRFIAYHKLNMSEVLDPIDSFKNFNSFFYRKLKPEARPLEDPDDPRTLVSGADCRMTAFQTVTDATSIWIKGRNFSIRRLLGDEFKDDAGKFEGGSLCIFRLAPQDYHRYHSCVDGTIGKMSYISGEYYTVNPIAIRSSLDVYAENARVIVPMDSPEFGRVYNACIGAMMVGSIKFTKNEGDTVKRGEEYGYFAFGGSTIVCLFEPNTVQFDSDILQNSAACIETLVRVGMRIGKSVRQT